MLYPHALQIPKSITPPPLWNLQFFSDPLEFLFDFIKLLTNGKLVLPPPPLPSKKILLTIFGQANKQLKFVKV